MLLWRQAPHSCHCLSSLFSLLALPNCLFLSGFLSTSQCLPRPLLLHVVPQTISWDAAPASTPHYQFCLFSSYRLPHAATIQGWFWPCPRRNSSSPCPDTAKLTNILSFNVFLNINTYASSLCYPGCVDIFFTTQCATRATASRYVWKLMQLSSVAKILRRETWLPTGLTLATGRHLRNNFSRSIFVKTGQVIRVTRV